MNEMNERRSSAEIVAEWRAELEIHDREAQDGDRTWHFTHYIRADPEMFIRAALRELDRLTAERDAARAAHAELIARLTRIADENETVCREHTSVGNDQDDAWVSAWGAAGKELREALGIESEAPE